nr:hypothetical protein [Pyrinomonadaceae bacterium]
GPKSIMVPAFISRRSDLEKRETINNPADVTNVSLSQTEITANCVSNSSVCADSKRTLEISTTAVDPEDDVLIYSYTVSGGKIIGQGAKVVWDLSGVKPGIYTIVVGVDDGCGVCGKTITQEIKVIECPNCN